MSTGRYSLSDSALSSGQQWYIADVSWCLVDGDAHWRILANAIEPSVCGGDCGLMSNYCDLLSRVSIAMGQGEHIPNIWTGGHYAAQYSDPPII